MQRKTRLFGILIVVGVTGLMTGACSSGSTSSDITAAPVGGTSTSGGGNTGTVGAIGATERDFEISLDSSTASAGSATFHVTNDGPATHQFVILKTDDAPDALPLDNEGNADESADGIANAGIIEDITPGSSKDLTVDLKPGKYVVICNLPGHYKLGMNAGLTVS